MDSRFNYNPNFRVDSLPFNRNPWGFPRNPRDFPTGYFWVFLLIKRFWPMKFLISKSLYGKSLLNFYNFANYSYRFCYIWSSCDFFRTLKSHTSHCNPRKSSQVTKLHSASLVTRALKSPNHWEWWLSIDSNHESLESLWLRTNSAIQYYENFTKITRLSSLKIYVTWKFSACLYLRIFSWTKLGWIGLKLSSQNNYEKKIWLTYIIYNY